MPHLIDKETGLCVVCRRLDIAAIKEGKKFRRQNYDVRKLAIDKLTSKDDPNYRTILDRHYVKYSDSLDDTKNAHKQAYFNQFEPKASRPTFTKKLPIEPIVNEDILSEDEEIKKIEKNDYQNSLENRNKSRNGFNRESLRKVNLAQISRINKTPLSKPEPAIVYRKQPVSNQVILNEDYGRLADNNQYYTIYPTNYVTTIPNQQNPNEYEIYLNETPTSNQSYLPAINNKPKKKKIVYHHHYEDDDQESYIEEGPVVDDLNYEESPRSVVYQPRYVYQ